MLEMLLVSLVKSARFSVCR